MAAVTICDFGALQNKVSHYFHCFPIYLPWHDGTGCHDIVFWMLSFKPNFSLSFFTFIKRLFSSSSLTAIRVRAMAPHSSTLAWKIPWTEEPGRLQSMGWHRVGHDWVTSLSPFTFMHWRRKWQSTPVFLPGESQGRGSLVGCHLWGRTESDTTEAT